MTRRTFTIGLAAVLVLTVIAGLVVAIPLANEAQKIRVTAYFANANGIYIGDDVRILGVRVGEIDTIEAQPQQVKITFKIDHGIRVPADAKAVILSPSLVSARAIQLVPAYTGGPVLADQSVIPRDRTAVPVEWDDLREQLSKLAAALQPTEPGAVSTLGAFVNTAADNLRGEGANIHHTVLKLSQAFSALGDHSGDIFGTVNDLSLVVSALQDSRDLMRRLNQNLAATTALISNHPNEIGQALADIDAVAEKVSDFVAENREPVGVTADKLASISGALRQSLDDLEQTLHVAPTGLSNFVNIYPPAIGGFAGAFSLNNFANPIQFLCGAIQAASRLNAEQSAKLCVQYLAPIVKNRQINFPPLGVNPVVGAYARPNEITYSEDWLRPDYIPPSPEHASPHEASVETPGANAPPHAPLAVDPPLLSAENPLPGPSDLRDMMLPTGVAP
ncbi:MCE family protein [Mycolicibacterium pulveris]|uniref:Mce family protein Mce3D n=1 Tax=Mycolicibacterium pulveris TaxID=36813 RepID=A0A7I7UNS3_MYCPV|nr:MCE family protein [Mycolicibacterium pulveris]MCV6981101.1 MCE family protein [Mycolicibacterium pulveris]BBY82461.1 Mce family protein Mce3D [Mycolicibacterium pulveris]